MANLIVVLASTDLSRLAEQIRRVICQDESLVLLAIGSGSVFVAVTAVGLARFQLAPDYLDVVLVPVFCDRDEAGNKRSALRVYADWPGRKFPPLRDLPVAS